MGRHKPSILLASGKELGSLPLIEAAGSRLSHTIIVAASDDELGWLPNTHKGEFSAIYSEDSDKGMAFSLRIGLAAAQAKHRKLDAVVVLLADMPFVTSTLINRLIHRFEQNSSLDYVASLDGTVMKPPILLARSMFTAVHALDGDIGARR